LLQKTKKQAEGSSGPYKHCACRCTLWLPWKTYTFMVSTVSQTLTKNKTFLLNQFAKCGILCGDLCDTPSTV